ncbi:hypothetical protein MXB_2391, partial [Myxobolus squamalis]
MNIQALSISNDKKDDNLSYAEKVLKFTINILNLKLVEEFGSNKMKRDARSFKRKQDITVIAASTIQHNINNLTTLLNNKIINEKSTESLDIFPIKNANAIKIEDIYDIKD